MALIIPQPTVITKLNQSASIVEYQPEDIVDYSSHNEENLPVSTDLTEEVHKDIYIDLNAKEINNYLSAKLSSVILDYQKEFHPTDFTRQKFRPPANLLS